MTSRLSSWPRWVAHEGLGLGDGGVVAGGGKGQLQTAKVQQAVDKAGKVLRALPKPLLNVDAAVGLRAEAVLPGKGEGRRLELVEENPPAGLVPLALQLFQQGVGLGLEGFGGQAKQHVLPIVADGAGGAWAELELLQLHAANAPPQGFRARAFADSEGEATAQLGGQAREGLAQPALHILRPGVEEQQVFQILVLEKTAAKER